VQLNDFPCNANGKIDRAALPDPEKISLTSASQIRQPENQVEESLLLLWTKVLNRTGIGTDHNFFEIGGDSMKVMKLFGGIEALYPRVLKIPDLFEHPTIAGQSQVIIKTGTGKPSREAPGYTTIQL
jgi:aryl carrier-like protein